MSDDTQLPDGVDESEREAFEVWLNVYGGERDDADGFRDAYCGEYYKPEDYVEEIVRECYDIPEWVEYYIDWASMARDWELNGDIYTETCVSGVYVFRG